VRVGSDELDNAAMPRRSISAALAVIALLLAALAAPRPSLAEEAPGFIAGLEDLPLMPGLSELSGSGFAFDTADGRIVEAYAAGEVGEAEVLRFYAETLPQLGWEQASPRGFRREGERLSIDFVKGGKPVTVHFSLAPE
jgi:hypothetical protein